MPPKCFTVSLGKDVKYSTVVDVGRKKKSSAANPIETVAIIGDSLVAEQVKLPNIVIPNIGLPIETLATSIRHFLHLESRRNVSGEITSPQKKLLLRLQIDEQDLGPDPVPGVLEAPDDLFVQAAKEVLVKVIELDLKDASSYNNLGVALRDLGKTDRAIAEFKKAAEIDPKYAAPHVNLYFCVIRARSRKRLPKIATPSNSIQNMPCLTTIWATP